MTADDGDPAKHWAEYAADLRRCDELGIKLPSDARVGMKCTMTLEELEAWAEYAETLNNPQNEEG